MNDYIPKKGDVGLLFGRAVMYMGNQIGDNATIFELLEGKGTFIGAKLEDFKLVGLSLEAQKEREQRLACCKAELWDFLSDGCLDIADEDNFTEKQKKEIIKKVFAEVDKQ
jgi:hypothetical protein